jgi:hypothetical protein
MKAQLIAPKNGRPYNQLAILALYTVSVDDTALFSNLEYSTHLEKEA